LLVENTSAWVDRLAWSPTQHLLAFSLGKYVQVWDAALGDIATLNFDTSSALDLTLASRWATIECWRLSGKDLDSREIGMMIHIC